MQANRDYRARKRGFVLISLSFSILFLLGVIGLAADIGRMYIAKNEAQTFVDSAALGAAVQLDGTYPGVVRSLVAVAQNPKRWNFANSTFSSTVVEFSTDAAGPWLLAPPTPPTDYDFVRVNTRVDLGLWFLPVLVQSSSSTIRARAVAGRIPKVSFTNGVFPFSPLSHKVPGKEVIDDAADPFGLKIGNLYTLRWAAAPKVENKNSVCAADAHQNMIDLAEAGGGSLRGYIQLNSASAIADAIEGSAELTTPMAIGDSVVMTGGAVNSNLQEQSLYNRVMQDTDITSATYAEYVASNTGNGRRKVLMPVNNGYPDYRITGFAGFFLLPPAEYVNVGGNEPACAEYIGIWSEGAPSVPPPPGVTGAYVVRLVQ